LPLPASFHGDLVERERERERSFLCSAAMAEGVVRARRPRSGLPPLPMCVSADDELFKRRIEFHPARKPLSAFALSGGDFHIETLNPSSDSRGPAAPAGDSASSSAAAGKRLDGGELHRSGLDPGLSFEITFRRISNRPICKDYRTNIVTEQGAGLANLGNTCFLNSVLQCLTYTEPFAAYLQSGKHKSSCRAAGFCALCALQSHVMDALQSTGKILRPFNLVKNLRCISRNFRNSRQEDAHEYMINLLESMHKCCLPSGIASECSSAYEKSLVHKIFGGCLRSQVKCMECSFCSNKFDPFLDLSLEIVKADTLCKALSHFTSEEHLDGGQRQYQCQQCKQKVRALKQLTIHKAPHVLTIHLKRFGSDMPGQKIDRKVDFESTLDLKPYVSSPEGDLKYTLYGVLVHAGHGTHSGHYFCFVRTSSGMWHSLNDHQVGITHSAPSYNLEMYKIVIAICIFNFLMVTSQVCQVSEKTVLQQKAYMLFYVRNVRSSSPKRAHDLPTGCRGESMPLKSISVSEHLLKKVAVMPTNGLVATSQQSTLLEEHIFHSSSKISSIEKTSRVGSSPQDATRQHPVVEGLMHVALSKDNENHLLEKGGLQNKNTSKSETQARKSPKILAKHKLPKSFYERNVLFGSRRLFLAALNLQKRKKLQAKRHLSAKENIITGILVENEKGDQGASTSVTGHMVDVDSTRRLHVSSERENVSCGSGDVNNVSNGSAYAVNVDIVGGHINTNTKRSVLSETREHSILEACTSSNCSSQRASMNLSKRRFWETPIPQWDGIELPPEIDAMDGESWSIGYILDDWVLAREMVAEDGETWREGDNQPGPMEDLFDDADNISGDDCIVVAGSFPWRRSWRKDSPRILELEEDLLLSITVVGGLLKDEEARESGWSREKELDRGKRKKVKNSRNLFDSGNPFQDISAARGHKKMKMDQTRSGNRPFRINN
ncbi:hypothetical protein Taro_053089, partial [Colocasia esculenta]|nr:hypothetical protein [Colocasia esculenta]